MKSPVLRIDGALTASSATAATITPAAQRDGKGHGTVTTVVVNGTSLALGAVGDRVVMYLEAR